MIDLDIPRKNLEDLIDRLYAVTEDLEIFCQVQSPTIPPRGTQQSPVLYGTHENLFYDGAHTKEFQVKEPRVPSETPEDRLYGPKEENGYQPTRSSRSSLRRQPRASEGGLHKSALRDWVGTYTEEQASLETRLDDLEQHVDDLGLWMEGRLGAYPTG